MTRALLFRRKRRKMIDDETPCTVEGIRQLIEENNQEQFIRSSVPELFFFDMGLEYIGSDSISFGVIKGIGEIKTKKGDLQ